MSTENAHDELPPVPDPIRYLGSTLDKAGDHVQPGDWIWTQMRAVRRVTDIVQIGETVWVEAVSERRDTEGNPMVWPYPSSTVERMTDDQVSEYLEGIGSIYGDVDEGDPWDPDGV